MKLAILHAFFVVPEASVPTRTLDPDRVVRFENAGESVRISLIDRQVSSEPFAAFEMMHSSLARANNGTCLSTANETGRYALVPDRDRMEIVFQQTGCPWPTPWVLDRHQFAEAVVKCL